MANARRQRVSSLAMNTLHSRITTELCDFLTSLRRCVVEGEQFIQHRLKARLLASRRHAARRWSSSIGVESLTATKTTCGSSMFRATEASVRWRASALTSASAVCVSGPPEQCRWTKPMGRRVGAIDRRAHSLLQRQRHEAFAGELAKRQPVRLSQRCVSGSAAASESPRSSGGVRAGHRQSAGPDQMLVEVAHRVREPDVSTR